jgi:hypothetical protein
MIERVWCRLPFLFPSKHVLLLQLCAGVNLPTPCWTAYRATAVCNTAVNGSTVLIGRQRATSQVLQHAAAQRPLLGPPSPNPLLLSRSHSQRSPLLSSLKPRPQKLYKPQQPSRPRSRLRHPFLQSALRKRCLRPPLWPRQPQVRIPSQIVAQY